VTPPIFLTAAASEMREGQVIGLGASYWPESARLLTGQERFGNISLNIR